MSRLDDNDYGRMIERLISARKLKGLTQTQVADLLQTGQSYISKVERCERRIDPIELLQFSYLYDVPVTELLGVG